MHVLFTTQPGLGHLLPLLPVAHGLRARGHEVTFAASPSFGADITAAGFAHQPVGRPWLTRDMPIAFRGVAAIPPGAARYAWARANVFAHDTAIDVGRAIVDLADRVRPDLVVRDAAEYGGYLAAERLGVPHAVVRTDTGSSSYGERHVVAGALDCARAAVGLGPDPDGGAPFRHLVLSFAPPALDEPDAVAAPTRRHLRPVADTAGRPGPRWLDDLLARPTDPLVYVTLGTVFASAELLAPIVDALADLPVQVVVATGGPIADLPAPPGNVRIAPWVPQATILPHCAAVVAHGGFGTVAAALGHGLPMVLVPISADQPANAARCQELGTAIALDPARRTAAAIGTAVTTVLTEPSYRDAASAVAAEAAAQPDLDHGLDLLEALTR